MSQQLVVITGVSGHVGFRVLVEALNRGHKVRAIIRKASQSQQIQAAGSIKPHLAHVEFIVIPDLLIPGAFNNVLDGADSVIHVASPLPFTSENLKRDIIDPAVNATLAVLYAAKEFTTIKRVVITSSIATLLTWDYIVSSDTTKVFTAQDTYDPVSLDGPFANAMDAYGVSKAAALAATGRFIQEQKPPFEVVNILPSMVTGRNELNCTPGDVGKGTNGYTLGVLLGNKSEAPTLGASVHVNDVARAHVDALSPTVRGNYNYLCSSGGYGGTTWEDAKDIVQQHFPKAVSEGLFPLGGSLPTRPIRLDSSKTEEAFGWKFASFEDQVKSVAQHYIELSTNEE